MNPKYYKYIILVLLTIIGIGAGYVQKNIKQIESIVLTSNEFGASYPTCIYLIEYNNHMYLVNNKGGICIVEK